MKRASYRDAIDYIAQMDSAGVGDADDPAAVATLITSLLVAEIFGVERARVGADVVARRKKLCLIGAV